MESWIAVHPLKYVVVAEIRIRIAHRIVVAEKRLDFKTKEEAEKHFKQKIKDIKASL